MFLSRKKESILFKTKFYVQFLVQFLMRGSFNFGKHLFYSGILISVDKKLIKSNPDSWQDFCRLICYSGKNLFCLGRIDFFQKWIPPTPEKILLMIFFSVFDLFPSNIKDFLSECSFKSKMQQKRVNFHQPFWKISPSFCSGTSPITRLILLSFRLTGWLGGSVTVMEWAMGSSLNRRHW